MSVYHCRSKTTFLSLNNMFRHIQMSSSVMKVYEEFHAYILTNRVIGVITIITIKQLHDITKGWSL